jgi:putative transposase
VEGERSSSGVCQTVKFTGEPAPRAAKSASMSRSGNVRNNAAMESLFSSLKTERIARKTCRTRNQAKAEVFDYIERFYNSTRRHSTLGYLSPMDFERQAKLA